MHRRTFLATAAVAASAGYAGCLDGRDSPMRLTVGSASTGGPTPTPTPERRAPRPTPAGDPHAAAFRDRIEPGIDVVGLETAGGIARLDYRTGDPTGRGSVGEITTIAIAYARVVERGWDVAALRVTALAAGDRPVRRFRVERGWAREYNRGEISRGAYAVRVFNTIETATDR